MSKNLKRRFLRHRDLYEAMVHRYVCEHCVDQGEDGLCHSKDPHGCGIFHNLAGLVEIALGLHKLEVEPYVEAVRKHICVNCGNSKGKDGESCPVRNALDCGLDRYLPLILEAIEAADKELA